MASESNQSGPFIVGLAHEYPSHSYTASDFENLVKNWYPDYQNNPGLRKLLSFNHKTQIESRRTIFDPTQWCKKDEELPTISQLSRIFRTKGVELAAKACTRALEESKLAPADITHTVAVTCTDQGNPGYDLYVCQKLQLLPSVQRVLLHGVGCAGGLSTLRTAADIAVSETQRGRPARVLVMACELCSLFLQAELQSAAGDEALHIAPALFSDAAAAVVVSNGIALRQDQRPILELNDWGSRLIPETLDHMSYEINADGMLATITKDVPKSALKAIGPMYQQLNNLAKDVNGLTSNEDNMKPSDFDWAIHPGGAAILHGAQQAMQLTDNHIRASLEVYRSYGNSSSPTVLVVLDKLRRMEFGRDRVIATSFGPGMIIEMFRMKRCREDIEQVPTPRIVRKRTTLWSWLQSRLAKLGEQPNGSHRLHRVDSGFATATH